MDVGTTLILWLLGAMLCINLYFFLRMPWKDDKNILNNTWAAFAVTGAAVGIWYLLVINHVLEPYMDEIFHIPQAQKYCQGKIFDWDDMITTPPGLYLVPLVTAKPLSWISGITPAVLCSPLILRFQNAVGMLFIFWTAFNCRRKIESLHYNSHMEIRPLTYVSHYSIHTAMNICLFPILFFFSSLYYTDVMSTQFVLVAFSNTLDRLGRKRSSFLSDIWTVILGTTALFMRQTNIFWVVVFMGGLEAVHSLKMLLPTTPLRTPPLHSDRAIFDHWFKKYSSGTLWDLHVNNSGPLDMVHCVLSIAVAALYNPLTIIAQIWPFITTLGLFVGFVIWNGGVVLGDKSNHVATIHLTQMLYIWPMFAFFMLPLCFPTVFELVKWVSRLRSPIDAKKHDGPRKHSSMRQPSRRAPYGLLPQRLVSYYLGLPAWAHLGARLTLASCVAVVVVYFNTIIHPFTLADNRHYMFYIFRYTIRRSELLRVALAPVYILCAWICWTMLGPCSDIIGDRFHPRGRTDCSEWCVAKTKSANVMQYWGAKSDKNPVYVDPDSVKVTPYSDLGVEHLHQFIHPAVEPALTSTVVLLLLATTLSLMTAPLVEPRYFILPWIFFRLLCPAWRTHEHQYDVPAVKLTKKPLLQYFFTIGKRLDARSTVETFWYLLINIVTTVVFLYFPFHWKNSDGEILDQGRLQRFLW